MKILFKVKMIKIPNIKLYLKLQNQSLLIIYEINFYLLIIITNQIKKKKKGNKKFNNHNQNNNKILNVFILFNLHFLE